MTQLQTELRNHARTLLETGQVDCVIGYEDTDQPLLTAPCFATQPEHVDRLVWNRFCSSNPAKYLIGRTGKTAVVAKGCDTRAIILLINEKQINRENLHIIGMPCPGLIDPRKIYARLSTGRIEQTLVDDSSITLKGRDFEEKFKIEDVLHDGCIACAHRNPLLSDKTIGPELPEQPSDDEYQKVTELENKTTDQRWEFFQKEFSKCIRCYACRQACPLCYCKSCFVDQSFPSWFGKSTDISDTFCFHITRAFHAAGRCVGCGACVRACPNNIDLSLLNEKIQKDVKELFDAEAGLEPDEKSPLTSYRENDPQDFIK